MDAVSESMVLKRNDTDFFTHVRVQKTRKLKSRFVQSDEPMKHAPTFKEAVGNRKDWKRLKVEIPK